MANFIYTPYYKISINGKYLSLKRKECIESVSINEVDDGSDTCTIVLNDPNFEFIEDDIFIKEATIHIEMGWIGEKKSIDFNGYISAVDLSFPESGFPQMSIFCLDKSHVMNREKKTRSWDNTTNADVVKSIAKEYGFNCVVQSGYTFTKEETISQSNVTDIEFCESLAKKETDLFMCKLINNTIYYTKKGLLTPSVTTLYYKSVTYDVMSFSPKINKETKKVKNTSSNIVSSNKTTDTGVASDTSTSRDTQGEAVQATTEVAQSQYTYSTNTGTWSKNS